MDNLEKKDQEIEEEKKWTEITHLIKSAENDLGCGQLITSKDFNMNEAMSAMEVGEIRMDPGMECENIHTIEEMMEIKQIPRDSQLSVDYIIAIMDGILLGEATWYSGLPSIDTILTCMYLHDTSFLEIDFFSIFCKFTLKNMYLIKKIVQEAAIKEEEDISILTHGIHLLGKLPDKDLMAEFKSVELSLTKKLKNSESESNEDSILPSQANALLARIRFRKCLFQIHNSLLQSTTNQTLQNVQKIIIFAKEQLEIIKNTTNLGIPFKQLQNEKIFQMDYYKRLLRPVSPRTVTLLTMEESFESFSNFLNHMYEIVNIPINSDLISLKNWLQNFSNYDADILCRSHLKLILCSETKGLGNKKVMELILSNIKNSYKIPGMYLPSDISKNFLDAAVQVFFSYIEVLCYNQSRQQRKMKRTFPQWEHLHARAMDLDQIYVSNNDLPKEDPKNYFLNSWVMINKLEMMTNYLLLGIPLELYGKHELSSVIWYLDYLYNIWVKEFTQLSQETERYIKTHTAKPKGKKKGKSKPKLNKQKQKQEEFTALSLSCQHELIKGTLRLLAGNIQNQKLAEPNYAFGMPEIRFFHRYVTFQQIGSPRALHYEHFKQSANFEQFQDTELYNGCISSIETMKQHFDSFIQIEKNPPPAVVKNITCLLQVSLKNLPVGLETDTDQIKKTKRQIEITIKVFESRLKKLL